MRILDQWSVNEKYSIGVIDDYPQELYLTQFDNLLLQGYKVLPWKAELSAVELLLNLNISKAESQTAITSS